MWRDEITKLSQLDFAEEFNADYKKRSKDDAKDSGLHILKELPLTEDAGGGARLTGKGVLASTADTPEGGMTTARPRRDMKSAMTYSRLELRGEVSEGDKNLGIIHIQMKVEVRGSDKC